MQTLEQSEQLIAELFDAQPESVVWFKPIWSNDYDNKKLVDFEVHYCNVAATKFLRAPKEAVINSRLFNNSVLDDASNKLIFEQCARVYKTGQPEEFTYFNDHLGRYYNVLRSKVKGGVLAVSRDRTEQYLMEQELKNQAKKYNTIIDASAEGVLLLQAIKDAHNNIIDFKITHSNEVGSRLAKIPVGGNQTLLEVLPHLKNSEQFNLHKKVIETGVPVQFETTFRNKKGDEYGWFIVSLLKLEESVLSRFVDITEKKENEQKIERQANLLNSIVDASINGLFAMEAIRNDEGEIIDFRFLKLNGKVAALIDKPEEEILRKTYLEILPSSLTNGMFDLKCQVVETGKAIQKETYISSSDIEGWFNVSIAPLGANGLVETFYDITGSKLAKERLRTVINTSQVGMFTIIPVKDSTDTITDFTFALVNPAVAAYIGQTAETLTGALASIFFPAYKTNGLFDIYVDTFVNGIPHQFDFHYEDGYDVYFNIKTVRMGNEVLVTFSDHTALKKLQCDLEASVEELKRSNVSLQEFAYVASHDLQEPLRKITFFADRLKHRIASKLNEEESNMLERMLSSSSRMRTLIQDLLEYSQVSANRGKLESVDLNDVIQSVISDLEATISEKNAVVTTGKLPVITGDVVQLRQMFQNLLENGLKYSRANTPPAISVTCRSTDKIVDGTLQTFHQIDITDNGIGFEQKYAERIFQIFQRLHGQGEYKGTGVGLAIVQKVVEHHKGFITAQSEPGEGTTFTVLLP
jgi:signal transduction histidine kinase